MSEFLNKIKILVYQNQVLVSSHGYDELNADNIRVREVLQGVENAITIREYPDYGKGPCILLLQRDKQGQPIHVVWGIEKDTEKPAVIVTAYRPDPKQWNADFISRRKS